jgi:hypothetical protein
VAWQINTALMPDFSYINSLPAIRLSEQNESPSIRVCPVLAKKHR